MRRRSTYLSVLALYGLEGHPASDAMMREAWSINAHHCFMHNNPEFKTENVQGELRETHSNKPL